MTGSTHFAEGGATDRTADDPVTPPDEARTSAAWQRPVHGSPSAILRHSVAILRMQNAGSEKCGSELTGTRCHTLFRAPKITDSRNPNTGQDTIRYRFRVSDWRYARGDIPIHRVKA